MESSQLQEMRIISKACFSELFTIEKLFGVIAKAGNFGGHSLTKQRVCNSVKSVTKSVKRKQKRSIGLGMVISAEGRATQKGDVSHLSY